jgi:hypothetical protein
LRLELTPSAFKEENIVCVCIFIGIYRQSGHLER